MMLFMSSIMLWAVPTVFAIWPTSVCQEIGDTGGRIKEALVAKWDTVSPDAKKIYYSDLLREREAVTVAMELLRRNTVDKETLLFLCDEVLTKDDTLLWRLLTALYDYFDSDKNRKHLLKRFEDLPDDLVRPGSRGHVALPIGAFDSKARRVMRHLWIQIVRESLPLEVVAQNIGTQDAVIQQEMEDVRNRFENRDFYGPPLGADFVAAVEPPKDCRKLSAETYLDSALLSQELTRYLPSKGEPLHWSSLVSNWTDSADPLLKIVQGNVQRVGEVGRRFSDYYFTRVLELVILGYLRTPEMDPELLFLCNDVILGREPLAQKRAFIILDTIFSKVDGQNGSTSFEEIDARDRSHNPIVWPSMDREKLRMIHARFCEKIRERFVPKNK